MIKIDMWDNDKKEQVNGFDIWFKGCFYVGNLWIFDKIVGDYYADTVQELKATLPHLNAKIDECLN